MADRLPVKKTYKLFIGGAFPRSESGRTYEAEGQNVARGSRKDARDAVQAARKAQPGWAKATAYNRGQVLYRLAEMVEARAAEFAELCTGREGGRAVDRPDRLVRRLGRQAAAGARRLEPRRRPVLQLHDPRADRRRRRARARRAAAPRSRHAPAAAARRRQRGRRSSRPRRVRSPRSSSRRRSRRATCPGGVVNILTGSRAEMAPHLASHMDVNAIDLCGAERLSRPSSRRSPPRT